MLQPHLSTDGGAFRAGEEFDTGMGMGYPGIGAATRLPDGDWWAVGAGGESKDGEDLAFAPFTLRSADGLTWDLAQPTGLNGRVEFHDAAVVDGTTVLLGTRRVDGVPEYEAFRAAAWTTTDGSTFTEVTLPGAADRESVASHLAVVGDRVVTAGRVGRHAAAWTSDDAGATWQRVEDDALAAAYGVSGLEADGDTLLATLAESSALLRSTDAGLTWQRLPAPGGAGGGEEMGYAPLWQTGDGFLTLVDLGEGADPWSHPEYCYADLDDCGWTPPPGVYLSAAGEEWRLLDTDGIGEVDRIIGTDDGRTLVLAGGGDGLQVATWLAGSELPGGSEEAPPTPADVILLADGERPEPGVRYAAPMYVHCGMDWFWWGGATWQRTDDGPGVETGAGQEAQQGWPLHGQTLYGYATLLDDGTVEYADQQGEVIATYQAATGAPGCE